MVDCAVVIPVYNDWPSLSRLVAELGRRFQEAGINASLWVVDDASPEPGPPELPQAGWQAQQRVRLACNLGHQRAIAVGLCEVWVQGGARQTVVLDADGEDRPEDVVRLLAAATRDPGVAVAQRARRSEGWLFRLGYHVYRRVFRFCTGAVIDFGNFCVISASALGSLCASPHTWNHLAASIVRSRLPLARIACDRGRRYDGQSKMTLSSLLLHGLSAISVFLETLLVRALIVCASLAALAFGGICWVLVERLVTHSAIPGWASTLGVGFIAMLLQSLLIIAIITFQVLNARSSSQATPLTEHRKFVLPQQAGSA